MSDTTAAAATPQTQTVIVAQQPVRLSTAQGAQKLAERRAANAAAEQASPDPVSEAARTLGKKAAEARAQARQAKANPDSQNASEEEEQHVTDDASEEAKASDDATQDEDAAGDTPDVTEESDEKSEPEQAQTITLSNGMKVTLDEVEQGFMLKADHTRKTQALADERRGFEDQRRRAVAEVNDLLGKLRPLANDPKPKTLRAFIEEFGPAEGIEKHNEHLNLVERMKRIAQQQQAEAHKAQQDACDRYLAETYNTAWSDPKVMDQRYTELSKFARSLGADTSLLSQITEPWMIKVLDMAESYPKLKAELEAAKSKVVTAVKDKPKVVKPGAKVSAAVLKQTAVDSAQAKAKQSGKLADAVQFLQARRAARG